MLATARASVRKVSARAVIRPRLVSVVVWAAASTAAVGAKRCKHGNGVGIVGVRFGGKEILAELGLLAGVVAADQVGKTSVTIQSIEQAD